jgi:MFS family permease
MNPLSPFTRWLARSPVAFTLLASASAFGAYACMYAFRRPFTVGTFDGRELWGFKFKVLLVVAQMLGYALSKFTGIKFVSEAKPGTRITMIAGLHAVAWLGLLMLALLPPEFALLGMFLNGLPLGMIWGLVFSFLEGRRVTEFLGLGLSVSFILASGWVKSAGATVMKSWQVGELWMPAVTAALFVPPLALCLWVMSQLPPPDERDIAERVKREPMDKAARRRLVRELGLPLATLVGLYLLLSVYRDLRDTFMVDVLKELGQTVTSDFFGRVETFAGLGVIVALAGLWFIRDHWRALGTYLVIILAGTTLIGASSALFRTGGVSASWWIALTGLGVYLAYVPFNSILFDRLLTATRRVGTASFLIYVADASGYAATVALYLGRLFGLKGVSWTQLTMMLASGLAWVSPVLLALAWLGLKRQRQAAGQPPAAA